MKIVWTDPEIAVLKELSSSLGYCQVWTTVWNHHRDITITLNTSRIWMMKHRTLVLIQTLGHELLHALNVLNAYQGGGNLDRLHDKITWKITKHMGKKGFFETREELTWTN